MLAHQYLSITGRFLSLLVLILACHHTIFSQDSEIRSNVTASGNERRQYHTTSLGEQAIKLDGILDDEVWDRVPWAEGFTEHQPDNGTSPTMETGVKLLYDDRYLYLAFRAYDTSPDSIVARLGRRDEFAGDWVEVNIDSYHDLRTAFSFTLSVSGVKNDEFVSNDGENWDTNWNPIWDAVTNIDSIGWTGEARIPFSQLRYGNQAEPVWGIQLMRRIFRKEERSTWQPVPRNSNGWVSNFGELHGLRNLPTNKQIELAPYLLAQTERFPVQAGNPFANGKRSRLTAGIDGKFSVTRDLILDFTVNPDFGQVEADPGAVRLDGYEIFFEERRPFFIESRNLFTYQLAGSVAGGDYDQDLLFYSRRIGGTPHHYPSLEAGEFADVPSFTSILGAAKFSGKTKNGLSIGILESITDPEMAEIAAGEARREVLVEPLTNYFIGRVIKDYDGGNTIIGGMVTAVNRKAGLQGLHDRAYSGGFDVLHYWNSRKWFLKFNVNASHVAGSKESIMRIQTGFVHLMQREDAGHVEVDPDKTSLTGTGGTLKIGKLGGTPNKHGGIYKFETGITWRSPELELNDAGFLLAADEINHFAWASYIIQQPFSIFNNAQINYNHYGKWDFGGRFLYNAFNTNANVWLKNNWRFSAGFNLNPLDISNNALRGTTALRKPPGYGYDISVTSDSRHKVTYQVSLSAGSAYEKAVKFLGLNAGVQFQPFNALRFSISPGYSRLVRSHDQFVTHVNYENVTRSIVSHVSQHSFSVSTRGNYYIRPNLSLQYYGQPFIFRALYKNFGYVQKPLGKTVGERFHVFTPEEITITDGHASVDENHDGIGDYSFQTPDLNFIQFRSNLVLRWEYVAGSEIYLVWSQGMLPNAYGDLQTPLVQSLFENVFEEKPHNIFLVKFSYRFLN